MAEKLVVIRCMGLVNGGGQEFAGLLLRSFDPWQGNPYAGKVQWTDQLGLAMRFETPGNALLFWQQVSTRVPVRPDGEPNRPLTAWTVLVEKLEVE